MAAEVSKQFLCRFFEKGTCRNDGRRCEFSHDAKAKRLPEDACIYFLLNKCIFGDDCRYTHIPINESSERAELKDQQTNSNEIYQEILDESEANTSQYYDDQEQYNEYGDYCPDGNYSSFDETIAESGVMNLEPEEVITHHDNDVINENEEIIDDKSRSYAEVVKDEENLAYFASLPLCPFAIENVICPIGEECKYLHGQRCEYCDRLCLHPYNEESRKRHHEECVLEHERICEESFAIQKSEDKSCGICMDIILKKEKESERRFGILEKCSHVFCLDCIRKWRQTKQFDNKTIRACPECRVASDFVVPHKFWVDSSDEKNRLIEEYKKNLKKKNCKYFDQGRGECRFGGACFYLHALPDGTIQELPQPRARRRQNQFGNTEEIRDFFLFNYLEAHEDRQLMLQLELEDFIQDMIFSDSDYDDEIL